MLRQFGLCQDIPVECNYSPTLHSIDLRGRHEKNWADEHNEFVLLWDRRRDAANIATGTAIIPEGPMEWYDQYMQWYRRITRRFIIPTGAIHSTLVLTYPIHIYR